MKKLWIWILSAAICLTACAPRMKLVALDHAEPEELSGLSFSMTPHQYLTGVAEVTGEIENRTGSTLTFGVDFSLEKCVSDTEWKRVSFQEDVAFISFAQTVAPGEAAPLRFSLDLFPALPEGQYRIVKFVTMHAGESGLPPTQHVIAATFTLSHKLPGAVATTPPPG